MARGRDYGVCAGVMAARAGLNPACLGCACMPGSLSGTLGNKGVMGASRCRLQLIQRCSSCASPDRGKILLSFNIYPV